VWSRISSDSASEGAASLHGLAAARQDALLVVTSLIPLGIAAMVDVSEARQRLLATTARLLAARGDQLVCDVLDA
jgi:hypothetical protein